MPAEELQSKDFRALEGSGRRRGPSAVIGAAAGKVREMCAAWLVALGVTPNALTVTGVVLTGLAAACLVAGAGNAARWAARGAPTPASWWPLAAAVLLSLACAQDVLDGAVARIGGMATRFGAVLDSTLDRVSDMLIFLGCAIHFALIGNVTYVTLSITAAASALLISYVKARAENVIDDCEVGYWQRPERCGMFLAGAYSGHVAAALWVLGTLPVLTVARRMRHVHRRLTGTQPQRPTERTYRWKPWQHPRGSAGYDLCVVLALAYIFFAPSLWPFLYGGTDPLRNVLERLVGR